MAMYIMFIFHVLCVYIPMFNMVSERRPCPGIFRFCQLHFWMLCLFCRTDTPSSILASLRPRNSLLPMFCLFCKTDNPSHTVTSIVVVLLRTDSTLHQSPRLSTPLLSCETVSTSLQRKPTLLLFGPSSHSNLTTLWIAAHFTPLLVLHSLIPVTQYSSAEKLRDQDGLTLFKGWQWSRHSSFRLHFGRARRWVEPTTLLQH